MTIYSFLDAMRKACVRTGKPLMDIVTHPGEIMKGSLEEVMKV